ncbi:MAG: type I-E CRISPR-associated protein Cse1/CasA [Acidobacteria bacterium]|nr:type I-E CRISPR-associated protein Cse1/CasA [Acidobacteriota bacterium]MBI3424168.1 type I-E CRISPR-associated protein Cse1/CasA [Acidobacteriota bacterium]
MSESKVKFSFNLINGEDDSRQNWIPCRMAQGHGARLKFFGLAKLFAQASQIREIIGDSPPVTIALYRLLLAIVHRSLGPLSYQRDWLRYRNDEGLFQESIRAYLNRKEPVEIAKRFDLFGPDYPFYQSSNTIAVRENLDQDFWGKLVLQDPGSALLFEHVAASQPSTLTEAQAARWLLALQAFDTGGTKTAEIDKEMAGPAPLLLAATGIVKGRNLFETLMLNLCWRDQPFFTAYRQGGNDLPAWEREDALASAVREPVGYLDLLTWQSRRIKLVPERDLQGDTVIRKAVIMVGYQFPKTYELVEKETMSAFVAARSANAKKGYSPLSFSLNRALWRDSFTLFHNIKDKQSKPLMFDWLNNLEAEGAIEDAKMFPIDFFGICADQAKLHLWRHERLPLPLRYLNEEELCLELDRALVFSEDSAKLLAAAVRRFLALTLIPANDRANPKYFQPLLKKEERAEVKKKQIEYEKKNGYKAAPKKPHPIDAKVQASGAELHYWPRLENEFRRLLQALASAPSGAPLQQLLTATLLQDEAPTPVKASKWRPKRVSWAEAVSKAVRQSFWEIVGDRGKTARTLRATALAENWFNAEFNTRQKTYLKGKAVKLDDQTNTERSNA